MGTKNKPGNFDCYANAHPDEPMFVLLARDPIAPDLVERWANWLDAVAAISAFSLLVGAVRTKTSWDELAAPLPSDGSVKP